MVQNLVEKAKRNVPAVEQAIEPGLVYPLLRWGDVAAGRPARWPMSSWPKTWRRAAASPSR